MRSCSPIGRAALLTLAATGVALWAYALPQAIRPVQQMRGLRSARFEGDFARCGPAEQFIGLTESWTASEGKAPARITVTPCAIRVAPLMAASLVVRPEAQPAERLSLHRHAWTRPPPSRS